MNRLATGKVTASGEFMADKDKYGGGSAQGDCEKEGCEEGQERQGKHGKANVAVATGRDPPVKSLCAL